MTNKEYYQRHYSTNHHRTGSPIQIPEDIKRVCVHTPCFKCGEAKGLCRHRVLYD